MTNFSQQEFHVLLNKFRAIPNVSLELALLSDYEIRVILKHPECECPSLVEYFVFGFIGDDIRITHRGRAIPTTEEIESRIESDKQASLQHKKVTETVKEFVKFYSPENL